MENHVIDVTESSFETEVVQYSRQLPVVVDFWATWCQPCRTLGPLLERLAGEAAGTFRLAKVDVDANNALAARFGVQSIPSVKGFRDGKVVAEFVGAQGEAAVRKFLAELVPSPAERMAREGAVLFASRNWVEAEKVARGAWTSVPQSGAAALLLLRVLLAQGKWEEAQKIIASFPGGNESDGAEKLRPLLEFIAESKTILEKPRDGFEAGYWQCGLLAARGSFPSVLDGLLDLLRQDKHYRADSARKVYLAILEVMGEQDPLTRDYRDRLASVLF